MAFKDLVQPVLLEAAGRFRGPGGAVAVIRDRELMGQHVWGFSDLDERKPMTTKTLIPICSISKQMVCAVYLELLSNPTVAMTSAAKDGDLAGLFTAKMHEILGADFCQANGLTIDHLCHMQSGLRDYWAETVLWGSRPDGPYSVEKDAADMRNRVNKSLHFAPGTEFSYSNTNFHLLARIIERVTGQTLSDLLNERVFGPAGMTTAALYPETVEHNTRHCVGYEGEEQKGYYVAVNRMEWSGDAGIVASLDDMIAYEKHLHSQVYTPGSWYAVAMLGGPPHRVFSDGATASSYRHGLAFQNDVENGLEKIGHGGALRGYRLNRVHLPAQGLSVIALFNHQASASDACDFIVKKLLNKDTAEPLLSSLVEPAKGWAGAFFDEGTRMAVVGTLTEGGKKVTLNYARAGEPIKLNSPTEGTSPAMKATLDGDVLRIHRTADNRLLEAKRLDASTAQAVLKDTSAFTGTYACEEIGSTVHIAGQGGMLYGSFDGPLGNGPPHLIRHHGEDVWLLACHRSLDAAPPGDWTLAFRRKGEAIVGVTIGCWLARRLEYVRINA